MPNVKEEKERQLEEVRLRLSLRNGPPPLDTQPMPKEGDWVKGRKLFTERALWEVRDDAEIERASPCSSRRDPRCSRG